MLRTSRNDHEVARATDSLFAAEAKLHIAFEHPHDLLICDDALVPSHSGQARRAQCHSDPKAFRLRLADVKFLGRVRWPVRSL